MKFIDRLSLVNEKDISILAIDIGDKGGFVWNDTVTKELVIEPMPDDLEKQWMVFQRSGCEIIVAENVHTMPGQGIVSNGTLMRNKGVCEGMAAALGIEIHFIEPLKWIECYTVKRTKSFSSKRYWKKHLIEIAKEMADSDLLMSLVNERTADAFLIWNYAASQQTPEPLRLMGLKL
jgi:hypothetical protein